MTIKPGDKFRTQNGHDVEITHINTEGAFPVMGRVKVWNNCSWTLEGKWGVSPHCLDLITPPERKSVWVNWYGDADDAYALREEADNCATDDRTHVLEIIMENDEPVDVKIHKVEE